MTTHSVNGLRRRLRPAANPRLRDDATPAATRRHLDRLRSLGSTRRIWLLGPDFRPKTVSLRRFG
jgi:hypothetical protein